MSKRTDAIDFIEAAIEASGDSASYTEYDLGGIADDLHEITGSWDMARVSADTLRVAVEQNKR